MNRLRFFMLACMIVLSGCSTSSHMSKSIQGVVEELKPTGIVVNCSDEVNKGRQGDGDDIGYHCAIEYTEKTIFYDDKSNEISSSEIKKGMSVKVTLTDVINLKNNIDKKNPTIIYAKEIKLIQ